MANSRSAKSSRKPVRQARQARSRATVESVLGAVTRILSEGGWGALNTNRIAETAGVSVGSVYEYFPNKEAIVDLVLDRHFSQSEAMVEEGARHLGPDATTVQIVQRVVAGFISLHSDDPRLHRVLSSEVPLSANQLGKEKGSLLGTLRRLFKAD